MGRVGIPTKYIFLRGLARGMVVDYGVLEGFVEETKKTTKNGKGRSGNAYQHTYIGESPTRPAACSCCSRRGCSHIFNMQTKLKGVWS